MTKSFEDMKEKLILLKREDENAKLDKTPIRKRKKGKNKARFSSSRQTIWQDQPQIGDSNNEEVDRSDIRRTKQM